MDFLAERDRLFSRLHSTLLKPQGFKKSGHWSVKSQGQFHWAVYLRASRFGNASHAVFWFDLLIFHDALHELLWGPGSFPGMKESTRSLVREEVGDHCTPKLSTLTIDEKTEIEALESTLLNGFTNFAIPLFETCHTLEGVLKYFISNQNWLQDGLSAASVALSLGREQDAREYISLAKRSSKHTNVLEFLEKREKALWSNFARG